MMELTSLSPLISDIRSTYDPVRNVTADCFVAMYPHKNQSATNIWKYFPPVLIVCGIIGNSLSIAAFRDPEMRSLAITPLSIAIAIFDIVVLTFTLTPKWIELGLQLVDYHGNNILGYAWHIQTWLAQSIGMVDHWLMVLVSIDRAFSVFRPLSTWVGRYKSVSGRLRFGMLCLVCGLLNSFIIYDFAWKMKQKRRGLEYQFECPGHERAMKIWVVWTTVITFLVPFVLIVLFNIVILCKLRARFGDQWYREETQQKRAKAATGRVNIAFEDKVDRRNKQHDEREGLEIEKAEGETGEIDNVMKREGEGQSERIGQTTEGNEEVQGSVGLEEKEIKEEESREEKQAKNKSREEKKLVDEKAFHTRFDGSAELGSSTTVCQAQRNIRTHLVVDFVFLVTDLPIVAYTSFIFLFNVTVRSSFLGYTICDHMMYLRHTFSFFVFGISEQFRKAVARLITKCTVKQTSEGQGHLEV